MTRNRKEKLEKNLIINSFKNCGLNLTTDGNEHHLIHCFKEGQPCANGLDMLKEQQNLLSNAEYLSIAIPLKSRKAIQRRQIRTIISPTPAILKMISWILNCNSRTLRNKNFLWSIFYFFQINAPLQ